MPQPSPPQVPPPSPAAPGRAEILAILAAFGDRPPEEVPETVDSMELAWLVHQLESRYGATVPDSSLVRMTTVTTVLDELAALTGPSDGPGTKPDGPAAGVDDPAAAPDGPRADGPAAGDYADRRAAAPGSTAHGGAAGDPGTDTSAAARNDTAPHTVHPDDSFAVAADIPLGDPHTARADSTAATGPAGGSGAATASPVPDGSASTGPAAAGSRGGDGGARG